MVASRQPLRRSTNRRVAFQSPSLRGSGRFTTAVSLTTLKGGVSIPFIAGQWSLLKGGTKWAFRFRWFQSPSLRGSGRFKRLALPPSGEGGFNPLHCGAVVASKEVESRKQAEARFNPLHCGAVVASLPPSWCGWPAPGSVSIPFIAGQWSLRRKCLPDQQANGPGFNPLHCGAVVASLWSLIRAVAFYGRFQSPSLRGSGRFR